MSGHPIFSSTTSNSRHRAKVHMTRAALPQYIDASQPPTQRSPWRQIRETPFVRTATLVMPEEVYQQVLNSSSSSSSSSSNRHRAPPRYGRATLTLTEILTGEDECWWWTDAELVTMLSEGRPGVDDSRFEIREGRLRMELSREMYEKCGLQGQPVTGGGGGRKHVKARWEVHVDLLDESDGRKKRRKKGRGFDRVLWAARNVLDVKGPRCWLVVVDGGGGEEKREEEEGKESGGSDGKQKTTATATTTTAATTWIDVGDETRLLHGVRVPEKVAYVVGEGEQECEDDWYEVVEWLDMVALGSDHITGNGHTDSSISRYKVPEGEADVKAVDLRVVRWTGLLSRSWITALLIEILRRSKATNVASWLALSVASHRTEAVGQIDGYTVLLQSTTSKEREEGGKSDGFQQSRCFQFVGSND